MKRILPVALLGLVTLAGCANTAPYSGNVYRGSQAQTAQSVTYGTITSIQPAKIQAESRAGGLLGTAGGAVVGGLLGSQVGGGGGRRLATAAGAIGGSVAGSKIEEGSNLINAYEIEVQTDSGDIRSVVQSADQQFQAGQRVRLLGNGGNLRVAPY
ncbi:MULTISPECIES: glycine zipper 2TM domain-containing protein [unclassified Vreelandella]